MFRTIKLENVSLRILQAEDVSEEYVKWFLNEDVVRYSDNQHKSFSLQGQRNYVQECLESTDIDLYGIFSFDKHIGNITLKGLDSIHSRAEINYVIGDTSFWGKGYAAYAISQIIIKARHHYKLKKLYAGLAEGNFGSEYALKKNGFIIEGRRKSHLYYCGKWFDQLDYGLIL